MGEGQPALRLGAGWARPREGGGPSERPLGPEAERGLGAGGLLERPCPQPERSLTSGTGRGRARVLTEGLAESGPAASWSCLYECRRGGEAEGEPRWGPPVTSSAGT